LLSGGCPLAPEEVLIETAVGVAETGTYSMVHSYQTTVCVEKDYLYLVYGDIFFHTQFTGGYGREERDVTP
jgi:hypothetical protein